MNLTWDAFPPLRYQVFTTSNINKTKYNISKYGLDKPIDNYYHTFDVGNEFGYIVYKVPNNGAIDSNSIQPGIIVVVWLNKDTKKVSREEIERVLSSSVIKRAAMEKADMYKAAMQNEAMKKAAMRKSPVQKAAVEQLPKSRRSPFWNECPNGRDDECNHPEVCDTKKKVCVTRYETHNDNKGKHALYAKHESNGGSNKRNKLKRRKSRRHKSNRRKHKKRNTKRRYTKRRNKSKY